MAHSRSFAWILASLLSLTLAVPLQADITPDGDFDPTGSSWWTGGGDSSTDAYIGKAAAGSVTVDDGSDLSSGQSYIGYQGVTGVVTVEGSGSTWTYGGEEFSVGHYGHGTLSITTGGAVSSVDGLNHSYIGYGSWGTGAVTVDGSDSTWTTPGPLSVGYSGQGTLDITTGGAVSSNYGYIGYYNCYYGSNNVVTVAGSGSTWTCGDWGTLYVGCSGHGTLNINDGGEVSNYEGYIGFYSSSTGEVTVEGSGSTWNNNSVLHVGGEGQGTLNITDGGTVNSDDGYIGNNTDSAGVVKIDGIGSTWTCDGTYYGLSVGYFGHGTLDITNEGAVVILSNGNIGSLSGSTGEVTVNGIGSTWTSGDLTVGSRGHGALNITNGGAVITTSDWSCSGYIGSDSGSVGVVTVDGIGSTWTGSSPFFYGLYVGFSGQGTLNIINGGEVSGASGTFLLGNIGFYSGSVGEVTVDGSGSTWTCGSSLYVGGSGQGTLNITDGGFVSNYGGYIGRYPGSTGEVTVDGSGSTWNTGSSLYVGGYNGSGGGTGELTITSGGTVKNSNGYIGYEAGATGVVTVEGSGSTWTNTGDLRIGGYNHSSSGTGELIITSGGTVSSNNSYIGYKTGAIGVVTVDGIGSTWTWNTGSGAVGRMYVGHSGQGTLNITNGGAVSSNCGYVGNNTGSAGVVTVDGSDSNWACDSTLSHHGLHVGYYGQGTLDITNGGAVSSNYGYIGNKIGAIGEVMVAGSGSTWTNDNSLYIGGSGTEAGGTGLLDVRNGGAVIADAITNWGTGQIVLGVSGNNMLIADNNFTNDGIVRLTTGVSLSAGTYTPISVGGDWLGTGGYEAIGGLWDGTLHTFTVAAAQSGDSGVEITVDLSGAPRLDITDGATDWQVGASFAGGVGTVGFTATAMTDPTGLADLSIMLTSGETILSGWDFNTDLPAGETVLLSFYVGDGYDTEGLEIWHYDDTNNWIAYDAANFAYADGWVSFTADGFSGYAVTNIPEPTSMLLLVLGGLAMLKRRS